MTVKEMIDVLSKLPQDLDLVTGDGHLVRNVVAKPFSEVVDIDEEDDFIVALVC